MILRTRLQIPPLISSRIPRNRLIRKLNQATNTKLTTIIAPAGFGKTTLLCDWASNCDTLIAWLMLEGLHLTPQEFLLYLIEAFRTVDSDLGNNALTLLNTSDHKQSLTSLCNDLLQLDTPIIFVLDDYHAVAAIDDINNAFFFLIQNSPPNIHFIMASRYMPDFNLARLRSQNQFLEILAPELRFTVIEVEQFVTDIANIRLTDQQRLQLESKTEGWIASLQLATNRMQSVNDIDDYMGVLSGQTQPIRQYLLEEIFRHQSKDVQKFLVETSFLDELCADLCDAVLGISNSQDILVYLQASQLFITPQDYENLWYHYQGILKEFLLADFTRLAHSTKRQLYSRASQWYEKHKNLYNAIHFAILAQADERVAQLISLWLTQEDWVHRDMYRLESWFQALSQATIEKHLKLYLNYVWLKLEVYDDVWDEILRDVERIRHLLTANTAHYSDRDLIIMSAQADMLMVNYARHQQEHQHVVELCYAILDKLPDDEYYIRGGAIAHIASAYEALKDYEVASQFYKDAIPICEKSNNIDGLLFASWKLMELLITQNDLPQALSIYDNLDRYRDSRTGPDRGAIEIAVGEVYRRMKYTQKAKKHLEYGIHLCELFPAWHHSAELGKQRLIELERQFQAVDTLTERELETLNFLQSDLSISDIADQLSVSISTIRTYCKRIYNKLHVHSRAEAVFRARELNII